MTDNATGSEGVSWDTELRRKDNGQDGQHYKKTETDLGAAWQYPQQGLLIQRYVHLKKSLNDQAPWLWSAHWANLIPYSQAQEEGKKRKDEEREIKGKKVREGGRDGKEEGPERNERRGEQGAPQDLGFRTLEISSPKICLQVK